MNAEPEITQRAAQPYVGISSWVSMATLGSVADRIPEIFGWLGARGFYLTDPAEQSDMTQWQTQLAFRLAD